MTTVDEIALARPHGRIGTSVSLRLGPYEFKRAATSREFDGVHRLNYRTFVREIRQHADAGTGVLIDKFHDKNIYFIAARDDAVVGMICVHDRPPFSVADRLEDPTVLYELGEGLLEVRLLAVEPDERHGIVFAGLIWVMYQYAWSRGYTHLVISGVQDRQTLYERLGFRPLGPAVPSGEATYIPMSMSLAELPPNIERDLARWKVRLGRPAQKATSDLLCLLPGPVQISAAVREAFAEPPISHRGESFIREFERVRRVLSNLVGGHDVALLCGSGTLANDAIAAALAADRNVGRGLLLVNGEFGERLVDHARRFGLRTHIMAWRWGDPWDLDEISATLESEPDLTWVWGVHQESSTGVLNDIAGLRARLHDHRLRLCLDCVSSLGAVPINLDGVQLASGVSGKCFGSFAGIAMVFAEPGALDDVDDIHVPNYLDAKTAIATCGPRFTCPSPLLRAFAKALEQYATPARCHARFQHYAELGRFVREQLRRRRIEPVAPESHASPVITTFTPPHLFAAEFLDRCRDAGFDVAGDSGYLRERSWVQIATMGDVSKHACAAFFEQLDRLDRGS